MTIRLYNEDSQTRTFQGNVLYCTPCEEPQLKGKYWAALDRTAFFPEGGGQSGDVGSLYILAEEEEKQVPVLDTIERAGQVLHLIGQNISSNIRVRGEMNWEVRFDRMQQHSAEHIASGIIRERYGYNNTGFHLSDQNVTMDFDGELTKEEVSQLEEAVNQVVFANKQIVVTYPSKEALSKIDYRSKMEIEGNVRLVTIPAVDTCACCAPHVSTTGEIGIVKIIEAQRHRGGIRMTLLAGGRAYADYKEKSESVKALSQLFSVPDHEVVHGVLQAKSETQKVKIELQQLQALLLEQIIKTVPQVQSVVCIFQEGIQDNDRREIVNRLLQKSHTVVAVFTEKEPECYQYVIGSKQYDVREYCKVFNELYQGRGGGKTNMVQGSVTIARQTLEELYNNFSCKLQNQVV